MKSWNVFLYNFCSQKLQLTLLLAKVYIESVQTVGREKCWCWCLLWTCPDCPALVRDMVRYVLQIFSLILFLSEVKFYDNGVTSDMKYFQLPVRRSTQRISSSGRLGWVKVSSGKARQEICHTLAFYLLSELSEPEVGSGGVKECGVACMARSDCGAFHYSHKCKLLKVSRLHFHYSQKCRLAKVYRTTSSCL